MSWPARKRAWPLEAQALPMLKDGPWRLHSLAAAASGVLWHWWRMNLVSGRRVRLTISWEICAVSAVPPRTPIRCGSWRETSKPMRVRTRWARRRVAW